MYPHPAQQLKKRKKYKKFKERSSVLQHDKGHTITNPQTKLVLGKLLLQQRKINVFGICSQGNRALLHF
jgi:hypothetical protein